MKDLLFPTLGITILGTVSNDQLNFWEQLAEKWGIGLVGLGLFCILAWWTAKREENAQALRDKKEDENQAERKSLLAENNQLQKDQLAMMEKHAQRIEQLTKDGNRSRDDHSAALRMMFRKMNGLPCVGKIEKADVEELIDANNKRLDNRQ